MDAERWTPCAQTRARIRAERGIPPEQPVIVFAGRLHLDKQPRVLAQVLQRLAVRGLDFHALLAGDGPDRAWLEEFISGNGLQQRVTLLGGVSSDEVRAAMTAGDIFFLPSRWEGIALTIYEAMACGLAVVGADVGGQRELVTPECGILLPKADEVAEVEAYAQQLAALLTDPARRAELGRRARERIAAHFRLDEMGDRMVALFRRAAELKARAPRPSFPPGWALESATQTVELARVNDLLDQGWADAQQAREVVQTHGAQVSQREQTIGELQAYIQELLGCKRWLEQRCETAERTAAEREKLIQDQQAWIRRLQKYKRWIKEWRKLPQKVAARLRTRGDASET